MAQPAVSIITPVLNRSETIMNCLRSVTSQTYDSVEHIVVDGGSTDGTRETLDSFGSVNNLEWVSEKDHGMYDALNKGLRRARGEIVGYLNSDDLYLPWSVEVAVERLQTGCDFVYGDLGVLTRSEKPSFRPQFYRSFDLTHFTHFEALAQPTVFWWREWSNRIGGFDTSFRLIGDCEYWLRAATQGASFCHIEEIMAIQVDHPSTLRSLNTELLRQEFRRLRTHYGPRARRMTRVTRSLDIRLRTRWKRIDFLFQSRSKHPKRWSRFIRFLHGYGLNGSLRGLLWYLAPGRLRPSSASMIETSGLDAALKETLSSSQ